MGFFYIDKERAAPRRDPAPAKARLQDIPVATMRQLGCAACPRDRDGEDRRTPKMAPAGPRSSRVYLLGSSPSRDDDDRGRHFADDLGREVLRLLERAGIDEPRAGHAVQCRGEEHVAPTECCRGRAEADIEACAPLVVVTVGDAALRWATGLAGGAPAHRGTPIVSRIGRHACYVFPLLEPQYVRRDRRPGSAYERVMRRDVELLAALLRELPPARPRAAPYDAGVELLTGDGAADLRRLEERLAALARLPSVGFDVETTGLRPYMQRHAAILTAAVGTEDDGIAFPLCISSAGHEEGWGTAGRERQAMSLLGAFLANSGRKVCHNLAMEQEWVAHEFGGELLRRTEWEDTMALAYVLDGRPGTKALGVQTRIRFGFDVKAQSPINVREQDWWLRHRLRDILRYNGMDAKWTHALWRERVPELDAERGARRMYEQRIRLAPALVLTEAPGLPVDFDYVARLNAQMRDAMREVEGKLGRCEEVRAYERKHGKFSPTNDHHVLELMHGMLKREECRRPDREGNVKLTTDEEALAAMPRREVPSARLVLEHREVAKLHGTYVLPALHRKWVCRDGRIRSKYGALVAITSRLQSEDPNAQNFPKRKHVYVRGMVYVGRGRWLVICDYGQIEFRVVAMASGDENLVRHCWTGYDVHRHWAERFIDLYPAIQDWIVEDFGEALAAIKAKQGAEYDEDAAIVKTLRQECKNKWVFPQLFGSTTDACATNLRLPRDVAREAGGEFWDEFDGVKRWQEDVVDFYDRHGYVETLTGFRRRGAMSVNEAINLPIQGTAAAIVQEAHMALSEMADARGEPELQPVLNVHDDLTFDVADDRVSDRVATIAREMCAHRFPFVNVPLVVEVSLAARWSEPQELATYRSDVLFGIRNPYAEERRR